MTSRPVRYRAGIAAAALLLGLALTSPARADASPKVRLVSAGKGAKAPLRFAPKVGQSSVITMKMEIAIGMTMGTMKLPPNKAPVTELDMRVDVTKVDPNGTIRYDFEYIATRVTDGAGLPAEAIKQTESSLAALKGMKGYAVVDTSGRTREADFTISKKLDPQVAQMLEGVRQSLSQLSVPFPKESVGVGAKWTVTMRLDQLSFPIKQVVTYELRSLQGSRGVLSMTIEQRAAGAEMKLPTLPAGTKVKLLSLKSRGQGEVTFDLHQLTPVSSTVAISSLTKTEISAQGQTQTMDMDMDMRVTIATQ